jgi:hypothetical protein
MARRNAIFPAGHQHAMVATLCAPDLRADKNAAHLAETLPRL